MEKKEPSKKSYHCRSVNDDTDPYLKKFKNKPRIIFQRAFQIQNLINGQMYFRSNNTYPSSKN